MDATIGLVTLILAMIGAWTVLRAIARVAVRGARAASVGAAHARDEIIGQLRSALRAAARVRDHRQHGHVRLQSEAIARLVNVVAELRAEIADLKSGAAPANGHFAEVIDLLARKRYSS